MNIVVRTDASLEIGTGHVMRCLTLAKQLQGEGADITFVCKGLPGNSIEIIRKQGFNVQILSFYEDKKMQINWEKDAERTERILKKLNKNVDLLIVDHYGLDIKWESKIRPFVDRIMVIDDLANRVHDCDILLDQNYYINMQTRYNGLVPEKCLLMLGPNYVLLREEFLSIDPSELKREGHVKNILVFFGGTDPTGETIKTLRAIQRLTRSDIEFNIIVGAANPCKKKIELACKECSNTKYYCQISNMAELMGKADLAIGAGGTTLWERCYLGLPSIIIIIAENQKEVTYTATEHGASRCLGESAEVSEMNICREINELCNNSSVVKEMVQSCWDIVKPNVVKSQMVMKNIMEILQ